MEQRKEQNEIGRQKNILTSYTVPENESSCYQIEGSEITRIENAKVSENNGIVGNSPIGQQNIFKIKVVKTECWGVTIGIKDVLNNKIIKYGGNGWISNCDKTIYSQGRGIQHGDIITVEVDILADEIKWTI